MENLCEDLRQYCNSIRNEVFRYLTILVSIRVNTVQQALQAFFVYLNIAIILIVSILSYSLYREFGVIFSDVIFTIVFIVIVALISLIAMLLFVRYIWKLYQVVLKATKFINQLAEFSKDGLRLYMMKLNSCCAELHDTKCMEDADTLCLDIEKLNELVS